MWARERWRRDLRHERGRTRASQVDAQRARRRAADLVAERHTDRLPPLQRSPLMRRMGWRSWTKCLRDERRRQRTAAAGARMAERLVVRRREDRLLGSRRTWDSRRQAWDVR